MLPHSALALLVFAMTAGCGGEDFEDTAPQPRPDASTGGTGGHAGGADGQAGQGGPGDDGGPGGTDGGAGATGGAGGASGGAGGASGGAGGTGATGGACNLGWANCDSDPDCETDTTSNPLHCGACDHVCPEGDHGMGVCASSTCDLSCTAGYDDCDGDGGNGCETNLLSDPTHCDACDTVCPGGDDGACAAGSCTLVCAAPRYDCDEVADNGCEANLHADINNCLQCGNQCSPAAHATPACTAAGCSFTCVSPYLNCTADDGCETDPRSNTLHCGGCNHPCAVPPHATATCINSQCGMDCDSGYEDCGAAAGCETPITTIANCGACGHVCGTAHTTSTQCVNLNCQFVCQPGWTECNTNDADDCETNTAGDLNNCGGCDVKCSTIHATPTCTAGVCQLACEDEWGNCDNSVASGCEAHLTVDEENCGACGRSCQGATCTGGYCAPDAIAEFSSTVNDFEVAGNYIIARGEAIWRAQMHNAATVITHGSFGSDVVVRVSGINAFTAYYNAGQVVGTQPPFTVDYFINAISNVTGTPATPTTTIDINSSAAAIQEYSGFLYWSSLGEIQRRAVTGFYLPDPEVLTTTTGQSPSLAVAASRVYWLEPAAGKVRRVATTGGTGEDIATGQGSVASIAANSERACWIGGNNIRCRLHTGSSTISTIASPTTVPQQIAAASDAFYWTTSDGALYRWTSATGAVAKLVNQGTGGSPSLVRVSNSYVYWLDSATNKVYRVAR